MIDKHNSTAYYFIVETEEIPIKFPQINPKYPSRFIPDKWYICPSDNNPWHEYFPQFPNSGLMYQLETW